MTGSQEVILPSRTPQPSKSLKNVSSIDSVNKYLALSFQRLAFDHGNTHALMDQCSNLDLP